MKKNTILFFLIVSLSSCEKDTQYTIGDTIRETNGKTHTVVNISSTHYFIEVTDQQRGNIEYRYSVDKDKGTPDGFSIMYDKQGYLFSVMNYQSGILFGWTYLFDQSGKITSATFIVNHQPKGYSFHFLPDGRLNFIERYHRSGNSEIIITKKITLTDQSIDSLFKVIHLPTYLSTSFDKNLLQNETSHLTLPYK